VQVSDQLDGAGILLTLDGKLQVSVDAAAAALRVLLPADSILHEESNVRSLLRKVSVQSPVFNRGVRANPGIGGGPVVEMPNEGAADDAECGNNCSNGQLQP